MLKTIWRAVEVFAVFATLSAFAGGSVEIGRDGSVTLRLYKPASSASAVATQATECRIARFLSPEPTCAA
ncbi:hypothetical protein [Dankookia sp. P2]|uniref:hypothetical protein n=1 Tax=Dankookia sp. P2 TaxID=3423955 RepID=UPI003D6666BF